MKDFDVICVGIAVVDFPIHPVDKALFDKDITQVQPPVFYGGGGAVNQAITLSRLGNKVSLATMRGADAFGEVLLGIIAKAGCDVDVSNVFVDEECSTGFSAVMIEPNGQRHFCCNRGTNNKFHIMDYFDTEMLNHTKVVSISGLNGLPGFDGEGSAMLFRDARKNGVITVADTVHDFRGVGMAGIRETLKYTDYFFPSYAEAKALCGEEDPKKAAQFFLNCGAKHVGIKLGKDGCYFRDKDNDFRMPAFDGKVVDTTGAGDSFLSGFITGLIRGWDMEECCRFANAVGTICVSQVGANTAIKSFEQIENFMKGSVLNNENCSN